MIPRGQYIGKPLGGPLYRPCWRRSRQSGARFSSTSPSGNHRLKCPRAVRYRSGVSMGLIPGLTRAMQGYAVAVTAGFQRIVGHK